jgi:hypothetical protein
MFEGYRLRKRIDNYYKELLETLRESQNLLASLQNLGQKPINYIDLYLRSLSGYLQTLRSKADKCSSVDCLQNVLTEIGQLQVEVKKAYDEIFYLKKVIPEKVHEVIIPNLLGYCLEGKDLFQIVNNTRYLSTIILKGIASDQIEDLLGKLFSIRNRINDAAENGIHECIVQEWRSFLQDDIESLENIEGSLKETSKRILTHSDLGELCREIREIGRWTSSIDSLSERIEMYEKIKEKYLSVFSLPKIVPDDALKIIESPEKLFELFSSSLKNEIRSLGYVKQREEKAEKLLWVLADCVYRFSKINGGES